MKEELKDIAISFGVMIAGFYARIQFGRSRFNWKQKLALLLFGTGIVVIMHNLKIDDIWKLSIVMVAGLLLPNIISAIISGGENSEKSVSKSISDKIKKYTK